MKQKLLSKITTCVKENGYVLLSRRVRFAHAIWFDDDRQTCMLALESSSRPLEEFSAESLRIIAKDIGMDFDLS